MGMINLGLFRGRFSMSGMIWPVTVRLLASGENSLEKLFSIETSIPSLPRELVNLDIWLSSGRLTWILEDSSSGEIFGYVVLRVLDDSIVIDGIGFDRDKLILMPKLPEVLMTAIYRSYYRPRRTVISAFLRKRDYSTFLILKSLGFKYFPRVKNRGYGGGKLVWGRAIPVYSNSWNRFPRDMKVAAFETCNMEFEHIEELLDIEYAEDNPAQNRLRSSDLRQFVARQDIIALVAEVNGMIVGSIAVHVHKKRAQILNVAVHPHLRRKGIASLLVEEAERMLVCGGVKLFEVVLPETQTALQVFFHEIQFRRKKTIRTDWKGGNDLYLFRKHISRKIVH